MKKVYVIFFLFLTSCATMEPVVNEVKFPEKIESIQSSFSETGKQDSGIIDYTDEGFIVTKGVVERYNHLISIYGHELSPPLKENYGISHNGESFVMSEEAMVEYIILVDKGR